MTRISADANLIIETSPQRWQLYANGAGEARLLLEAAAGEPLRYHPNFAVQRRLPVEQLPASDVERIVLGYSPEDSAWLLGLIFTPERTQIRGGRWCEVARWSDSTAIMLRGSAESAGRALAERLARPFVVIEPKPPTPAPSLAPTAHETSAAAPPAPPLPPLPLKLDLWTLTNTDGDRLQFQLAPSWGRQKLLRSLWYLLWAGVFVGLSVASLNGPIALPRPEFLPYLGLGCAVLLVVVSLAQILSVVLKVKTIVVDAEQRAVIGRRGGERWRIEAHEIEAVYASLVVNRVNRRQRNPTRTPVYGELNLLLTNERFRFLVAHGATDEKLPVEPLPEDAIEDEENLEAVLPLSQREAATTLQAAALYVAQALGKPAFTDRRMK